MKMNVKMPRVGETVDEVYLVSRDVTVGDTVAAGDNLMDVETDKATVQVPSPVAGKIVEVFFNEGDAIKTGDVIAVIES
ncbi:MAG: biotin/lipoyl-containing protein [Actinomycetes bacterium]